MVLATNEKQAHEQTVSVLYFDIQPTQKTLLLPQG